MTYVKCKICLTDITSRPLMVTESMFGTGEIFRYYLCDNCRCLQISERPENTEKYYPEEYYTHNESCVKNSKFKNLLYSLRSITAQTKLYRLLNSQSRKTITDMIHYGSINFKDRILDVGCGNGSLLKDFLRYGFKNLTGIDPFLKMETKEDNIRLLKKNLFEEEETYDVIIFNHSFEHIWEQRRTLIKSSELLSEKGCLIIRMPVVNYAFEKYRENWIQIDAPRHFFVHSLKSFEILCKTCNLKTDKIIFDSTEFQFIASEQLKMGIFLTSHNSYYTDQSNCQFTQDELKSFRHLTRKLNKKYLGDQAVFFIRKVS